MTKIRFPLLAALPLIFALAFMSAPLPAKAQKTDPKMLAYKMASSSEMGISILREPRLLEDQFILRFSPKDRLMTGCLGFNDYAFETAFKDIFLDIMISTKNVTDRKNATQEPHLGCDGNIIAPKADVVISKKQLEKNKTKYLRISNGPFMDFFEIVRGDHFVELIHADEMSAFQMYRQQNQPMIKNTMKAWFYPENTYILYMPGADPKDSGMIKKLARLADKNGMVPLNSVFPEFTQPIDKANSFYYVDKKGAFTEKLGGEQGGYLDRILVETTSYELEGDVKALKEVAVYARKPVMYE